MAMTVASIFYFEFWFLWGVVLNAFLGAFWTHLWILRASLGVLWASFGLLWMPFGCCGVPWGSFGDPRRLLGPPWAARVRFPRFSGKFRAAFGFHFEFIFRVFLFFCWALFFDRFLKRFCIDFGTVFGAFLVSFFRTFQTSRKMLHTTKML